MTAAVEAQRAEIRTQREKLTGEIQAQVPALARDIATRVLGREVRS
jgi:F0F1-type ATP synthase membrane subunit b/b'